MATRVRPKPDQHLYEEDFYPDALGLALPLAEVYDGLSFPVPEDAAAPAAAALTG